MEYYQSKNKGIHVNPPFPTESEWQGNGLEVSEYNSGIPEVDPGCCIIASCLDIYVIDKTCHTFLQFDAQKVGK